MLVHAQGGFLNVSALAGGFTPASYFVIIPMNCSPENLHFMVHPLLVRTTNTSMA
jgi:hypothetical protein